MDYELRGSLVSASTQSGGVSNADVAVANSMSGMSLSLLMQSPQSWLDFGLRFEQFMGAKNSDRDLVFRTLGLVLSKEIRYYSFFLAPEVVVNFLSNAHYSSGGTELWRAQSTATATLGASLGWRYKGLGLFLGVMYRSASLGRIFNSVSGSPVAADALGARLDFGGMTTSLGISILL